MAAVFLATFIEAYLEHNLAQLTIDLVIATLIMTFIYLLFGNLFSGIVGQLLFIGFGFVLIYVIGLATSYLFTAFNVPLNFSVVPTGAPSLQLTSLMVYGLNILWLLPFLFVAWLIFAWGNFKRLGRKSSRKNKHR
jgi:hypothetical protein